MVGGPLGAAIGAGVGALFSAYLGTPAGKDFLHNLKQGTFGETNKGEDTNQGDILK
jgi:hypothetical protein